MIVLENLVDIFDRFNLTLTKKFISKLKLFLNQKTAHRSEFVASIKLTLLSLMNYVKRKKGGSNEVLREVVNFFVFLSKNYFFSPDLNEEKEILDLIVDIIKTLDDDILIKHIIKFEENLDNKFLMNFYIRTRLVVDQFQQFVSINESIIILVEYLRLALIFFFKLFI